MVWWEHFPTTCRIKLYTSSTHCCCIYIFTLQIFSCLTIWWLFWPQFMKNNLRSETLLTSAASIGTLRDISLHSRMNGAILSSLSMRLQPMCSRYSYCRSYLINRKWNCGLLDIAWLYSGLKISILSSSFSSVKSSWFLSITLESCSRLWNSQTTGTFTW